MPLLASLPLFDITLFDQKQGHFHVLLSQCLIVLYARVHPVMDWFLGPPLPKINPLRITGLITHFSGSMHNVNYACFRNIAKTWNISMHHKKQSPLFLVNIALQCVEDEVITSLREDERLVGEIK